MKQNGNIITGYFNEIELKKINSYLPGVVIEKLQHTTKIIPDDETRVKLISDHFKQIMILLGLDINDDSLKDTPDRVAKMYVKEIFSGLNIENKPGITLFENKYNYNEMLLGKNITIYTYCEHHFVPIVGKAHVAYYPGEKVIGLSKINRIVEYYCKRLQVQERLTNEIAEELKEALQTDDVAVVIDAVHFCVASRGVRDTNSSTITFFYGGRFLQADVKSEFLNRII